MQFFYHTLIFASLFSLSVVTYAENNYVPSNDDIAEMNLGEILDLDIVRGNALQSHVHRKGEFMLRYSFMAMNMNDLYAGSKTVSEATALDRFMVTPISMDTTMHMLMPMYGINNRLSVMVMIPYVQKQMMHRTRMGAEFETKTDGLGDIEVIFDYAAFGVHESSDEENIRLDTNRVIVSGGWSTPVGSIDEKGDTPAGSNLVLPFPMQLGSGTWDLLLGATYLKDIDSLSFSIEFLGQIPLNKNERDYSKGNEFELTVDGDYKLSEAQSISGVLKYSVWGDYDGFDKRVNPTSMPTIATKREDLRSGERLDFGVRYNYYNSMNDSTSEGFRIFVEIYNPLYQFLDSYNLGMNWMANVGGSFTF